VEGWSGNLRRSAAIILSHPLPMALLWGPDHVPLYNDDHAVNGSQHAALDRPLHDIWPELERVNGASIERAWAGEAVLLDGVFCLEPVNGTPPDHSYAIAASPLFDDDGAVEGLLVTVLDRTPQLTAERRLRHAEEQLAMLVAELQSRVRNILTVVRSVFLDTIERRSEATEAADHFRGRLDALARTQTIVAQTAAGTADLENLIRDEFISVGLRDGPNVRIRGPDVLLSARIAEPLGLALHELTTNALKFGALRCKGALVDVSWTVDPDADGIVRLDLIWQERGVPAVAPSPSRDGFGRALIEQALPSRLGAQTRLDFMGGGLRCVISVPLDQPGPYMTTEPHLTEPSNHPL
jgi:two-component sensor histidine kinase